MSAIPGKRMVIEFTNCKNFEDWWKLFYKKTNISEETKGKTG